MGKDKLIYILYNLAVVISLLTLFELGLRFLLYHPRSIPNSLLNPFRQYYSYHVRNTIQMDTACARYDTGLFYTLKPGNCQFKNIEFNTSLSINSLGVRDTEAALESPETIFLGDSFTMGWGTSNDSCFVSILRPNLRQKILNAGVSSYGTVRELKLLERINTDSLKTLVIQYHANDYEENKKYIEASFNLKISSLSSYLEFSEKVRHRSDYYLGKHAANIILNIAKNKRGNYNKYLFKPDEVTTFISVLMHSPVPLANIQIIFLETCSHNNYVSEFSDRLQVEIKNKKYPDYIRKIKIVKLEDILSDNDYYILDDHIRPSGHKKIADRLLQLL